MICTPTLYVEVALGRRVAVAERVAQAITSQGGEAMVAAADVLARAELEAVRAVILARWNTIDILVNAAGGTTPEGTVPLDKTIFDMPLDPIQSVINLNLVGTLLPCQIFGEGIASHGQGCIVNISSLAVPRAVTRAVAYSAGKAAMENFTRWLAVELATKFGAGLRVNAITPGFFLGEQNRRLLVNEDASLTARGQRIIEHTPARRFGEPDDLVGALIWLCSKSARFVNGSVIVVDGGVNAFSGI
jgi:NAD(P)-dependent dehydrogenase (short-subunit alcohol dehydrogenase family)